MKVKSLKNFLAKADSKDRDTVVVRMDNEYGVPTYYDVEQVRHHHHPFVREGCFILKVKEMTFIP